MNSETSYILKSVRFCHLKIENHGTAYFKHNLKINILWFLYANQDPIEHMITYNVQNTWLDLYDYQKGVFCLFVFNVHMALVSTIQISLWLNYYKLLHYVNNK